MRGPALQRRVVWGITIFGSVVLGPGAAMGNGFEAPVEIDKPAPAVAGQTLPFPLVDEPVPVVTIPLAKELPNQAVILRTPNLANGAPQKDAAGRTRNGFESVTVRQSRIGAGKVTIPALLN